MARTDKYSSLRRTALELVEDVFRLVSPRRHIGDGYISYVRVGEHYYQQELESMSSFERLRNDLLQCANVQDKYQHGGEETLIIQFIEAVLAAPPFDEVDVREFNRLWKKLCSFLDNDKITVRTIVGLANFEATKERYVLDADTRIVYFPNSDLRSEVRRFFFFRDYERIVRELSASRAFECKGAIVFDMRLPATYQNVEVGGYLFSRERVMRRLRVTQALRLAGFGRLVVGPIITVANPEFPIQPISIGGEPVFVNTAVETPYRLGTKTWSQIKNAHDLLSELDDDLKKSFEDHATSRNCLVWAIERCTESHESQKLIYRESVLLDLVITLESLYGGGKQNMARATSNLLGTTHADAKEVFENIQHAYEMRNKYAHRGELSQSEWEEYARKTCTEANLSLSGDITTVTWRSIEILRDYTRRSIMALLNLHCRSTNNRLDKNLRRKLRRLHLTPQERYAIQKAAKCTPLSDRFA